MALPPFATVEELGRRLPGGLSESDTPRAEAALEDIAAVIRLESGHDWTTTDDDDEVVLVATVPPILAVISITAARREMANPDGVIATTTDGYSERLANASTGVYLTKSERQAIRRASGRSGLWPQGTTRGAVETPACDHAGLDDQFLDVVASEPIPFLPVDG